MGLKLFDVVAAVRRYLHPHQRAETRLHQPCSCSCCFQTATETQKVEKDVILYLFIYQDNKSGQIALVTQNSHQYYNRRNLEPKDGSVGLIHAQLSVQLCFASKNKPQIHQHTGFIYLFNNFFTLPSSAVIKICLHICL